MSNSARPREFDQVQRWLLSVITYPGGVVEGIDSEQSRRQLNIGPEQIERVIARSRRLTSVERLQVYASAYYARLIECLQEEFPALRHALGDEAFGGFAFAYLQSYPPQSYTLAQLGANFPRFLEETRPSQENDGTGDPNWPDFLIDIAKLERTYGEVFDGPGPERQRLLQSEDLAAIHPPQPPLDKGGLGGVPDVRLIPVQWLRLLELRYPVHEYATAARRREHPPIPEPQPTYLVVSRWDYIVRRRALSRPAFELLRSLCRGQSVGEAIATAAESSEIALDDFAERLRTWFSDWAAAGFFRAVERVT